MRDENRYVAPDGGRQGPVAPTLLDLTEVAIALSDALDLVGGEDVRHGKRVAFMAESIGRALRLPVDDEDDLFLAALLHDSGVSSTTVHQQLTENLDWEGSDEHCLHGFELFRDFQPFRRIAEIIRRHHTSWEAFGRNGTAPVERLANVIFLADRVDVLAQLRSGNDILLARHAIRETVVELSGSRFAPDVVEAFLAASRNEAFWLTLEAHHLDRYIAEATRVARRRPATPETLRQLARVFARIVDGKSPYTAQHSVGVARLSQRLGERAGLGPEVCSQLEIAGLLHDLGKLRVPDGILEKPARLSEAEFASVSRHTFETYQILRRVEPFRTIALWAASHHEGVSGHGYPFHIQGDAVSFPARIVAVADVFQALSQNRPYRTALPPGQIVGVLKEMAADGMLDADVVTLVESDLDQSWKAAVGLQEA